MNHVLLIFVGGLIGLVISGPPGALFGGISGFAVGAWQELKEYRSNENNADNYGFSAMGNSIDIEDQPLTDFEDLNPRPGNHPWITHHVNPATGLQMVGNSMASFDVGGNPYGINLSHDEFYIDSISSTENMFSESDPFL